jgi:hypothetical protein
MVRRHDIARRDAIDLDVEHDRIPGDRRVRFAERDRVFGATGRLHQRADRTWKLGGEAKYDRVIAGRGTDIDVGVHEAGAPQHARLIRPDRDLPARMLARAHPHVGRKGRQRRGKWITRIDIERDLPVRRVPPRIRDLDPITERRLEGRVQPHAIRRRR